MSKLPLIEPDMNLSNIVNELTSFDHDALQVQPYLRAALLGFACGLRSLSPLALLDWSKKFKPNPSTKLEQILNSPATRIATSLLATGELVVDKLPGTPSRLNIGPLLGRLSVGALAGVSICQRYRQMPALGLLLGAAGAWAGSYAGYYARTTLSKNSKLPGFAVGLLEDGAAYGLGLLAVRDNDAS
ncbi:DUF4126 family protein [Ktedonosporobacter rubrisoli]|uniref:DUF4126 family protein n=1 Tax=Ktedonosporobacter rubrisoli TaxID=2509675 RepID=A0A4P6JUR8_KTERU|nr:DUF4126 family protein [Ktedonosporobacter rubrisoli]QBD78696.1 DUF4126 family protein [Ktedonosporobacter rubrisoli]